MFETLTRAQQGDLGELRAVYELSKLGYTVSIPTRTHIPYDLVIEKNGHLSTVQVKTTTQLKYLRTQTYVVHLSSSGGNKRNNTRKPFEASKVDWLFVMTSDNRCWLIPTSEITGTTCVLVGSLAYSEYQLDKVNIDVNAKLPTLDTVSKLDKRCVIPPFSPEELQIQILQEPVVHVAKKYGMTDNGLARWIKKWNLQKPSRGYWQKLKS